MVIGPQGDITVCCAYSDPVPLGHIQHVDDLEDFFLEDSYTNLRAQFKRGFLNNPHCHACYKINEGVHSPIKHSQSFNLYSGLQYIEYTTSNVCNQSCATCSSKFSSQWVKIDSVFDRAGGKVFSLSDSDIDKIIKVLPNLKEVQLKGGEPFADLKNLRVLEALVEVNPDCGVTICSNMQMVPKRFFEVLSKLKNVSLAASVDAIGERFNWIRGGDFDSVNRNMNKMFYEYGILSYINPCVSVYNFKHLRELYDYYVDTEYTKTLKFYNVVTNPNYLSVSNIFSQDDIDNIVSTQFDDIRSEVHAEALYKITSTKNEDLITQFIDFTKKMDGVRGFSIMDNDL